MGRRKYTCVGFREYETAAMAEYLEAMAAKGWMLTGMVQNGIFCFKKQEPQRVKFCVAVLPDSSEFESKDREEARQFREYCEEAGWRLLYGGTLWQIFTSEEEAPVPIETDLALQLETQKSIALSRGNWVRTLAISGCFLFLLFLLLKEPGKAFARPLTLPIVLLCLGTTALFPYMMISRILWYRKAKGMLERSGCLPPVSLGRVKVRNGLSMAACLGVYLFIIFFAGDTRWEGMVLLCQSILAVVICSLVLYWLREHGSGNRRETAIGYFVGVIVLGTLVVTAFSHVMLQIGPKQEKVEVYQRLEPFPVSFQELGYEEEERWYRESMGTWLSFYQTGTGVRMEENSGKSQVHLTYYESPIPLIIAGTKKEYPRDRGNVWEIEKTETQREDGIRVTRYRYELEQGNIWETGPPVQDTYLLSDRNRLFVLSFTREVEAAEIEPVVELFARRNAGK